MLLLVLPKQQRWAPRPPHVRGEVCERLGMQARDVCGGLLCRWGVS